METISTTTLEEVPTGCGCPACQNGGGRGPLYLNQGDDIVSDGDGLSAPSTAASKEQFSDYLIDGFWTDFGTVGRQWAQDTVTFSISNEYASNDAQGIRDAFAAWSDVADIAFVEVSSGGNINVVEGDGALTAYSSSSIYMNTGDIASNTISVNMYIDDGGTTTRTSGPTYGQDMSAYGDYAKSTILHEIGHSLGLGHTGDYNGSATYANDAQWTNDSTQYSLMSYFQEHNTGAQFYGNEPSTPMLMDIYAIQQIYGANMTTRTGDSVYGFNSNAGGPYDFTNHDSVPVVAIWDAGGIDTIDVSGYSTTQLINLNEGQFSNVYFGTGNLAIAYGVVIENAIGGSGDDTFYGNAVNNVLTGNAGNDYFYGSLGSDTIIGGANASGGDTVNYSYDISEFIVALIDATTATFQHIVEGFTDTISSVENFIFDGTSYSFSELEEFAISYESIANAVRFDDNTQFNHTSSDSGDITFTAGDAGYSGGGGNFIQFSRDFSGLSINVLNPSVLSTISTLGSGEDDVISYTGTTSGITTTVQGLNGDDTISAANEDGIFVMSGGNGDDILTGGNAADIINGGQHDDTLSGGAGNDRLIGDFGNDIINGGDDDDYIRGDAGNDELNGDGGNDAIYGGTGVDTIRGGAGDDRLFGEAGADIFHGDAGNDLIYGGDHYDTLNFTQALSDFYFDFFGDNDVRIYDGTGTNGNDTVYDVESFSFNGVSYTYAQLLTNGASYELPLIKTTSYFTGNYNNYSALRGTEVITAAEMGFGGTSGDVLEFDRADNGDLTVTVLNNAAPPSMATLGSSEADAITYAGTDAGMSVQIRGLGGDDVISGADNDGAFSIFGGTGNDDLTGGNANDGIRGEDGDDTIDGGAGDDKLFGDAGDDVISGGAGNDRVTGGADNDELNGGAGVDLLFGDAGNDTLDGGADNDRLEGGDGIDDLQGGLGNDRLYGGNDSDTLDGGAGNDLLYGQGGDDLLLIGDGSDTAFGGAGADTFRFTSADGQDAIRDFVVGEDTLDIANLLTGFTDGVSDINDFVFINSATSTFSQVAINADGVGNDWVWITKIVGTDLTGTDVDTLLGNGTLIV